MGGKRNLVAAFDRLTEMLPSAFALGASAGGLLCLTAISIIGDAKDAPHILQLIGFLVELGLVSMKWFGSLFVASYITKIFNGIRNRELKYNVNISSLFSLPLSFIFLATCYVSIDGIGYFSKYVNNVLVCDAEMKAFYASEPKEVDGACLKIVNDSKASVTAWVENIVTIPSWVGYMLIVYLFVLLVIIFVTGEKNQGNGDAPTTGSCNDSSVP